VKKELQRQSKTGNPKRQAKALVNNDLNNSQVPALSCSNPDSQDNILTPTSYFFFKVAQKRHLDINRVLRWYFTEFEE